MMSENCGIMRNEALTLLRQYVKKENMINHCLASEAVMRALAVKLGEDPEIWGLAGLLHDIDVEITDADPLTHGRVAVDLLASRGVSPLVIDAISMHNEASAGKRRETVFQHALAAGETITGLIIATTLVHPDKKIASVKTKSVVKRMKEKAFAASVNRDTIMECEKTGVTIDEFAEIAVTAMKDIAGEIGL